MQAWNSQFEKPTSGKLIGELDESVRPFYQDLRKWVVEHFSSKPKIEWLGLTLGWCESFTPQSPGMLISLHLVANPNNPRVEMALSKGFFDEHPPLKLPKQLHSGLSSATCIGHQTWCAWSINSQDSADAICQLITLSGTT